MMIHYLKYKVVGQRAKKGLESLTARQQRVVSQREKVLGAESRGSWV